LIREKDKGVEEIDKKDRPFIEIFSKSISSNEINDDDIGMRKKEKI
jgi:hypothetical protein